MSTSPSPNHPPPPAIHTDPNPRHRATPPRTSPPPAATPSLAIGLDEATLDHSTLSRTRRLLEPEVHKAVFDWVLREMSRGGLVKGKTIGVDSTTLEANAAMKSIVRRDTGEGYTAYLQRLAAVEGVGPDDMAALRRMDRKRKKKTSNDDWQNPNDPDAQITRMKDGHTALAHKVEIAVDMQTGAILAATAHGGAAADTEEQSRHFGSCGEGCCRSTGRRVHTARCSNQRKSRSRPARNFMETAWGRKRHFDKPNLVDSGRLSYHSHSSWSNLLGGIPSRKISSLAEDPACSKAASQPSRGLRSRTITKVPLTTRRSTISPKPHCLMNGSGIRIPREFPKLSS